MPVSETPEGGNGWGEWRIKVLSDLKEIKDNQAKMVDDMSDLKVKVAVTRNDLKNKASIWGAISGFIGAGIALLLTFVSKLV